MGGHFCSEYLQDTIVVFYSTLSAQKCKKLNTEKQNEQGHLGSNLRGKIKILEKRLSTNHKTTVPT